jgi:glycosyltransferase involved in cell wall biosynthesis
MLWFPRRARLVVEINTNDLGENALGSRPRAWYNAATRGLVLGRAKALVFVTSELSRRPSFRGYGSRHCVITNGIELDAYPVLPARPHADTRLAFVGSPGQPWQGIDKVLKLASLRADWRFDIVGMTADSASAPSNVRWHGQLDRDDLIEVLVGADVGLGTLALHRKAMDEASSLKVREYLALGLPVIYANVDLDADGLGEYALRIANTESNVVDELPRIAAFVERVRGERVPRSALAGLDVERKEQQRLALFREVAGA